MVYVFLADGFEEIEALCPIDIMRRAGISVVTVGISKKEIIGAHNITVITDITDSDLNFNESIDILFLPGGMPGTKNLDASSAVHRMIDTALEQGSYIAAICAAPMILGKRGLLQGKKAVCYPGFEEYLIGATVPSDKNVVLDGNVITARGMGVATEFGLALTALLCGSEKSDTLRHAIIAD